MADLISMVSAAAGTGEETDPNFNQTVLLLHGDGTNGAQNNTFLDSSPNNFTITRNGNTTQGSFSPYGNRWSNYFDGNGDWLSRAFTSTTDGMYPQGNTYTIEAWVYLTSTSGFQEIFCVAAASEGAFGALEFCLLDGVLLFGVRPTTGGTGVTIFGESIPANSWNHIAVSLNAGDGRLFLNGTQVGPTTTMPACSFTPVGWAAGRIPNGVTSGVTDFNGYISDMRLVQGTAVYTSNFTPPTAPLTAISGTSLLTCQSNRFKDNSSNNFTITRNGDVKVTTFSPYAPSAKYNPAVNGGSGYFDGSGDRLQIANTTEFDFGTGDFTVECWMHSAVEPTAYSIEYAHLFGKGNGVFAGTWTLGYYQSKIAISIPGNLTQGSTIVPANTWNHFAVTRSSGTVRLFVNGVQDGSATITTDLTSTNTLNIGDRQASDGSGNYPFNGYISNVRVIKGTALYTSNFTPPTAPLTAVTNTSLLCNFTNAGIFDNTGKNNLETVGNAQIDTSVKKFGTGSLEFDGSGDMVYVQDTANNTNFGVGAFTIEFWVYPTAGPAGTYNPTFYSNNGSGAWDFGSVGLRIHHQNAIFGAGTSNVLTFSSAIQNNIWTHVAVVRSGNTITAYLNGNSVGSISYSGSIGTSVTKPLIGASDSYPTGREFMTGYIDDLRITKGIARYTANFTPPEKAFPNL
jgi:hypothetical protein